MKAELKNKIKTQAYSFAKTYVTVFLAVILTDTTKWNDFAFIKSALLVSLVSVVRNFYKLLTEKNG